MISYTEQKEQWFEHFLKLPVEEQYEKYLELMDQNVSDEELIEDDFGSVAVDLKSHLIQNNQYEKAICLIEKTKESTDEFYQQEYSFLGNFAVEYYLYKKDLDKFHAHLQPFIANPDHEYDLFLPLYHKILFYQMNKLAITLTEEIYEPIKESDKLIGGAESELVDMIFYNAFQEFYQSLVQNTEDASVHQLKTTLKKFDFNDAFFEGEFPEIVETLTKIAAEDKCSIFTGSEWAKAIQNDSTDAIRNLYWSFAVYMLEQKKIHFTISANIWFPCFEMLSKAESLSDFSFTFKDLDKLIGEYFGILGSEDERGFAVTWGIAYIYDFLLEQELVSKDTYAKVHEHVDRIKKNLIKLYENDVWRFDFVHTWGKSLSISDEAWTQEINHFHQTFTNREMINSTTSRNTRNNHSQLSLFDDLLDGEKSNQQKKSSSSKAAKSKKRKQAKKQRKKNRKK